MDNDTLKLPWTVEQDKGGDDDGQLCLYFYDTANEFVAEFRSAPHDYCDNDEQYAASIARTRAQAAEALHRINTHDATNDTIRRAYEMLRSYTNGMAAEARTVLAEALAAAKKGAE